MEAKQIFALIEERKEELFTLLSDLIKIDSQNFSTYGREEECARYIHKLCLELGLESDIFSPLDIENFENHPDYMPGRNLENRPNVVARYRGMEDKDELMLMAHIDTVEIGDPANWELDPLSGAICDEKIFGRGACDDKYAIASMLFLAKLLKEANFTPKYNLLLSAYSDEEHGGSHGALAAVMKYPTDHIVSLDGDYGQIWHCASGGGVFEYKFHTKDTVDNAIYASRAMPAVLDAIDAFGEKRRAELEANRFYKGTIIPDAALRYMEVRVGSGGTDMGNGRLEFAIYTDKTKDEIYAELAELEKDIAEKIAPFGMISDGIKPTTRFFHYVFCEPDSDDIKDMCAASMEATGKAPLVCGSCLSDLSVISKHGSSNAFGYGAGRDFSEVGGAHQPNEYIECDAFLEITRVLAAYILKKLG